VCRWSSATAGAAGTTWCSPSCWADGTALNDQLWAGFARRLIDRVTVVTNSSLTLAEWQRDHVRGNVSELMARVVAAVSEPA
jgi:hypothetical protein